MASVATFRAHLESSLPERLFSTLSWRERAASLTVSTGVTALDVLTGGLPRGALSEITGPPSSGRTGVMLAALSEATRRQEVCALVDANDSLDPTSAAAAGVNLERLLWIRCGDMPRRKPDPARALGCLEQVLKVTDLLLHGGGCGMVVLDLGDIPFESERRVPLTSWFRFRRAVEPTPTVLLLVEQEPCAGPCASLVVRLERRAVCARYSAPVLMPNGWRVASGGQRGFPENNAVSHAALLSGMQLRAEVVRCSSSKTKIAHAGDPGWTQRKPTQSASVNFELRARW